MSQYEIFRHGTVDFPIGIHRTYYIDGFWLYPHIHREFELLLMKKGSGLIYIDGEEYPIKQGDGIFINSLSLHLGKKTNLDPCEFYAIVFSPEIFGNMLNDKVIDRFIVPVMNNKISLPTFLSRDVKWQSDLLSLADKILTLNNTKPFCHELGVKSALFGIWELLFSHSFYTTPSKDKEINSIKTAMEFIQKEYASPLALNDISSVVNMSREHFCRRFSYVMHMTPFEYLNQIRVDNSCRMLSDTDLSIGEIAEKCGFNSFSYFSKKFREKVGFSPAQYRKRQKQKENS